MTAPRLVLPRPSAGIPRLTGLASLAACAALLAGSCAGSTDGQGRGQGAGAPVSTPMASFSPSVEETTALLRAAVATAGYRLDVPPAPYRPSETASLAGVPRAVLRASTPDAGQGFVVIYELPDAATAATQAKEMAAHLGSGFGQTNYPSDAQFHVAQVNDTVVFTWWSRAAASDAAAAEAVFEALRTVGVEVPVIK